MSALTPGATVHIVGVGGAGMSGVARLLHEMGCLVTGSDALESEVTTSLRSAGIPVDVGHRASQGARASIVLWSPAIAPDNEELVAARQRGATLLSRAELLAELAQRQPVIGLTGTHGKTTATSMMVHVLSAAQRDDSRLLGASVTGVGANGHWGNGALVLEVDESYGTFALLSPYALGLLNVEADHLDHYGTVEQLEEAFGELVDRTSGPVVAWGDDAGVRRVAARSGRRVSVVSTRDDDQWSVSTVRLARRGASFTLHGPDVTVPIVLRVTGFHNVINAAVVAVLALAIGAGPDDVRDGLGAFQGAPRRFEFLGQWRGVDVYEDYAHLPGEIRATLTATRAAGYQRITAVFQPHRVTRTLSLASAFAPALDQATHVVVTDVYTAGEPNPSHVSGAFIAEQVRARGLYRTSVYAATFNDVVAALETVHDDTDVVLLLGAGDVGGVAARLAGGVR